MKRRWICAAAAAALLTGAGFSASAEDLTKATTYGTWGYDLSARDLSVKPGDDFYRYAEGKAIDSMTIPADRSRWGSFEVLRDLSDARSRAVIEKAGAETRASGEAAKIGGLYRSFMDEARVDGLGVKPMQAELDAIR